MESVSGVIQDKKFFVITTQLITGVTFGLVAFSLNLPHFFSISIALLAIIAFSGATHDIACDGVYMSELSNDDQAKYIGWQGAFYNIAKIIATGGLVYLAGYLIEQYGGTEGADSTVMFAANQKAWMIIMTILCVIMVILGIYHLFMLPSGGAKKQGEQRTAGQVMTELANVLLDFSVNVTLSIISFHHSVPICRRICNENCSSVLKSQQGNRRLGIKRKRDRTLLWYIWCGSIRSGIFTSWILYISTRT